MVDPPAADTSPASSDDGETTATFVRGVSPFSWAIPRWSSALVETVLGPSSVPLWIRFNLFVLALLALDLGVFHRQAHEVGFKEAATWSGVWIALALCFNLGIWNWFGEQKAIEFLTDERRVAAVLARSAHGRLSRRPATLRRLHARAKTLVPRHFSRSLEGVAGCLTWVGLSFGWYAVRRTAAVAIRRGHTEIADLAWVGRISRHRLAPSPRGRRLGRPPRRAPLRALLLSLIHI